MLPLYITGAAYVVNIGTCDNGHLLMAIWQIKYKTMYLQVSLFFIHMIIRGRRKSVVNFVLAIKNRSGIERFLNVD